MTEPVPARDGPEPDGAVRGNAADPGRIGAMFDRISGVYDPMNALISGFAESRWRRRTVAAAALAPGMSAIDVATGTGRVAADLARRVGPTGRVVGIDVAPRMIERARAAHADIPWLEYVVGDALALPVADRAFDAATIAFGMRNLPDYRRGFAELCRVVRPGGRVACLEIARPSGPVGRFARLWFERAVPFIGRLVGHGDAYAYLVASVRDYPAPPEIAAIMRAAGLVDVGWAALSAGMVTIHVGRRPDE